MLMTPITLDTSSAGAPTGEPAAAGAGGLPEGGERFADQLALAQSTLPAGQNLAAGALPLQTVALGPGLEVITSPAGTPDGDSLAAFARAQGLDEDVVAWLFPDAALLQQAQALAALPVPGGFMVLPGAAPGVLPGDPALATATPSPSGGFAAAPLTGLTGQPGPASAPADPDLAAALAAVGTAGWLQSQATGARLSGAETTPDALDPAQAVTLLPNALLATAAAARGVRPDGTAETFRLATPTAEMPVEVLSLDIQAGLEALWDDPAGNGTSAGHGMGTGTGTGTGSGSGSATGTPAGAPALPEDGANGPTPAQRAAGYQELSQRLGEALAQRVMAQIERGNWEVRLLLKPARLGEIEIDLSLRSGALDAAFRASNPVTRDLLNDGLPRLREVLAHAGMDIAGLNVGSGRSQQTGGNPTPRHAREPQGTESADRGITATAAPASTPRLRGAGESGWDVLV